MVTAAPTPLVRDTVQTGFVARNSLRSHTPPITMKCCTSACVVIVVACVLLEICIKKPAATPTPRETQNTLYLDAHARGCGPLVGYHRTTTNEHASRAPLLGYHRTTTNEHASRGALNCAADTGCTYSFISEAPAGTATR